MSLWNDKLLTGHPDIDREHRAILEALDRLGAAMASGEPSEHLATLLRAMRNYASMHFANEERLAHCTNCPLRDANCAAHQQFQVKLTLWQATLARPDVSSRQVAEAYEGVTTWLLGHIAGIDRRLAAEMEATVAS